MMKNIPIEQILLNNGNITQSQLGRALEFQKNTNERLGRILIELGYVTEQTLLEAIAERMNVPYIDILSYRLNPEAAALLPRQAAEKYTLLPIDFKNDTLVVAANHAMDVYVLDEIRMITEMDISIVLAGNDDILACIRSAYGKETAKQTSRRLNRDLVFSEEAADPQAILERVGENPVVQMVNTLIDQAHVRGASDIHIEPSEKNLAVRYRINGDLIIHVNLSMEIHNAMVARLKIMGGMNIAERRLPQDGKCHVAHRGLAVDLRISTLPTIFGEKVEIRLLSSGQRDRMLSLDNLGMTIAQTRQFEQMLKSPNGMILVSGPTGSGKTSTLYAALSILVKKKINILTVEDPVEKVIEGISQVQINPKAGLTFAKALRAFLRQDPDVIMVGEMRDSETAAIGVRAAITGHLVLATIHTNDCASTITRLIDMGVPSYMAAASLTGIVAQRLVKRLCPRCKTSYIPSSTEIALLGLGMTQPEYLWEPVGCEYCNYTGYVNRTAIYEMLRVDSEFGELITKGVSVQELRHFAAAKGVRFLSERVIELAIAGETSIEEVEKIIFSVEF